jgi:hypothetical protein
MRVIWGCLLAVATAACADRGEERPATDAATSPAAAEAAPTASTRVDVAASDSGIQLSANSVQGGSGGAVTFAVTNRSQEPHELTVRGSNRSEWKSGSIQPGGNVLMSLVLTPGVYELDWPAAGGSRAQIEIN